MSLTDQLRALDMKNREFYDRLTEEQRKKFSLYLMFKYSGSVEGHSDLQEYYLLAQNKLVNQNFFALSKHPKLQWLLLTTVSPGVGTQRHYYLKTHKSSTRHKLLDKIYPDLGDDEIKVLQKIMTSDQIVKLAQQHGIDDSTISDSI